MFRILTTIVMFAAIGLATACLADEPLVVPLWPGEAPDDSAEIAAKIGEEIVRMSPQFDRSKTEATDSTRLITRVTRPSITIIRPASEANTSAAMLIFPGGGYWDLYWEVEGEEVAKWLVEHGMTAILVKYRVPRRPGEPERAPAKRPLQDAQRALRLVRCRASEWAIAPDRIGVIGFSAGGHLAIASATSFDTQTYPPLDAIDEVSCRPDFAVAAYSGYLNDEGLNDARPSKLAHGLEVHPQTPPVFLVHGGDDIISQPEHSVATYLLLRKKNIPAELHIYDGATHGFGVRTGDRPFAGWTEQCLNWLKSRGLL